MKLYEINDKIRELLDMLDEGVIGSRTRTAKCSI